MRGKAFDGSVAVAEVPLDLAKRVPRLLRVRCFLIAFGGRRRDGDIIFFLERHPNHRQWKHAPFICCLDLVLSPKHDAARGALRFWCARIIDGFVVGTFQSPPCETWSIARYMALALGNGGPPPLRSAEQPFGLPGLTFKQLTQLEIGSFLLFSSLAMITAAALSGCAAMLEHPAFVRRHTVVHAASIWRLPEVHRLLLLPGADLKLVLQGEYGMSAVKPTHLGTWRLPDFDRHAARLRKPMDFNVIGTLTGLNTDGSFKTAVAKEYAPPLCDLIASSFIDAAASMDDIVDTRFAQFEQDGLALSDFICHIEGAVDFGADFVDTGSLPLFALEGADLDVLGDDALPTV